MSSGNIRSQALKWYKEKYGRQDPAIYATKLYLPEESWTKDLVWFVQVPLSVVQDSSVSFINILCQDVVGSSDFFHLKIPSTFFLENLSSFDMNKEHIAFYLSPRAENFLQELRGTGKTNFKQYLINK